MSNGDPTDLFETRRSFLTGLAYRILGSMADAEDAVQDTYLKWLHADHDALENPLAWLRAVCTRQCIDMLRSARRARVDYVGIWLPEPVRTDSATTPEHDVELASSLSMAFLLLLERLSPRERAAYLLHDIFDQPYDGIARALGTSETACRKLVSRARLKVGDSDVRHAVQPERQEALLAAFRTAVESGDTKTLATTLSEDIELRADGGGKVPAHPQPVFGRRAVLDFVSGRLAHVWQACEWRPAAINGARGALLYEQGRIMASVSLACDTDGRMNRIFIVRNPDKIGRLDGRPQAMPLT